jgi:hypothetical protein
LGKVTSVAYDEAAKSLTADIEEDNALAASVDEGYYPDVSIGAKQRAEDGKMYLHHLAYLGEEAPAIKDLRAGVADSLGIAAHDGSPGIRILPAPSGKRLRLADAPAAGALGQENERLRQELQRRDLALSDAGKRSRERDRERLKTAMAGRLPLFSQEKALQIADALDQERVLELSDGAGGTRAVSAMEAFLELVGAVPKPVRPGILNLGDAGEPRAPHGKRGLSHLRNKG